MLSLHVYSQEKPHVCEVCGRAFSRIYLLKMHCLIRTTREFLKVEILNSTALFTQRNTPMYVNTECCGKKLFGINVNLKMHWGKALCV